ncbi:MAG: enoyl-CoA hydratase/isomerase family protein [Thermoguttaceae bacterium]|nr:enoyl-CoA hydratase/isomerase family protein [Thermoguttaceae bacterium]
MTAFPNSPNPPKHPDSSAPLTRTDDERGVATLTLNRPERCNALSFDLLRRLLVELRQIAADDSTRLVVLRGAGKHFCAGLDLDEATNGAPIPLATLQADALDLADFRVPVAEIAKKSNKDQFPASKINFRAATPFDLAAQSLATPSNADFPLSLPRFQVAPRLVLELLRQIRLTPKPIVAAVRGAACGGGAGLVSVCDFVVADSTFRAVFTETKRGLSPSLLFPFLRRKYPLAALQEFVLTAAPFAAPRAVAVGLVQTLVEPGDFDATVAAAVDRFLANEPRSLETAKRLFNAALLPTEAEIRAGWLEHCRAWESSAGREGIAAFLEKRSPCWTR